MFPRLGSSRPCSDLETLGSIERETASTFNPAHLCLLKRMKLSPCLPTLLDL